MYSSKARSTRLHKEISHSGLVLAPLLCGPMSVLGQSRTPLVQSMDVRIPAPVIPVNVAGKRHLVDMSSNVRALRRQLSSLSQFSIAALYAVHSWHFVRHVRDESH